MLNMFIVNIIYFGMVENAVCAIHNSHLFENDVVLLFQKYTWDIFI